jgi:hypothetical protein
VRTQHQYHEVPEAYEAGGFTRTGAETRIARLRVCRKDMAVLCIALASSGAITVAPLRALAPEDGGTWGRHVPG